MLIGDKMVNDLDGFYELIKDSFGEEKADFFIELIGERILQETDRFKKQIDIYSRGFEQALFHKEFHERVSGQIYDHLDSADIIRAELLNYRIYKDYDNPNYYARLDRGESYENYGTLSY